MTEEELKLEAERLEKERFEKEKLEGSKEPEKTDPPAPVDNKDKATGIPEPTPEPQGNPSNDHDHNLQEQVANLQEQVKILTKQSQLDKAEMLMREAESKGMFNQLDKKSFENVVLADFGAAKLLVDAYKMPPPAVPIPSILTPTPLAPDVRDEAIKKRAKNIFKK